MDTKACAICGIEFSKPKVTSRRVWEERRFCSRACYGKSRRTGAETKNCEKCGAEFTRRRVTNSAWAKQRYCSTACAYADRGGAKHYNWKDDNRFQMPGGYIGTTLSPEHPMFTMAQRNGRVMVHRLVMAESLGRPLAPSETVHHKNGDRTDNRLENLQLRAGRHGKGMVYTCRDCGSHNIEAREI